MHPSPCSFPARIPRPLRPDARPARTHPIAILAAALLLTAVLVAPAGSEAAGSRKARSAAPSAAGGAKSGGLPLGVVASVNGVPIRQIRLDSVVDQMIEARPEGSKTITAEKRLEVRKDVLRTLVGRELLLQQARKQGYTASDKDVEEGLSEIRKNFFEGSEEKLQAQLRHDEMSMAELRENLKESIVLSKLKRKIYEGTSASPEEIRRIYDSHKSEFVKPESVRARNIFIKADRGSTPEQDRAQRARIEAARAEASKGDFEAAARKYSEARNASSGGDMGDITRQKPLMPDMIDILFKTPPGQISEPFRNEIGWHVVKVEGKTPEHQLTLEEATSPISRGIRIQKTEREMAGMAARLWREGKVESRIDVSPETAPAASPPAPPGR